MKKIKIISLILSLAFVSLMFGSEPVMSTSIKDNVDNLISYYNQIDELNEWEALGLKNLGINVTSKYNLLSDEKVQPTDYARIILGNIAANNQQSVINHVYELQTLQKEDGSFKISDSDTLNNTVWTIIALETAKNNGYEEFVSYNRDKALTFITTNQLADGSFNGSGWGPEADSTAHALIALSYDKNKYSTQIIKALNYIENTKTADSLLVGTWGPSVESTAVYIEALMALNHTVNIEMVDELLSYQLFDSGAFYPTWDLQNPNQITTYSVLNALADYYNNHSKYHINFTNQEIDKPIPEHSGENSDQPSNQEPIITPSQPNIDPATYKKVTFSISYAQENIITPVTVKFFGRESVYTLLIEILEQNDIPYKARSGYVSEIAGLKERQPGYPMSGWLFLVNGKISAKGSNNYYPNDGDKIEWVYSLDGGKDIATSKQNSEIIIEQNEIVPKLKEGSKIKLNTSLRKSFNDTKSVSWAKEAVEIMAGNNIIHGTGYGFEPYRNLTRAELIAMLLRIQEIDIEKSDNPFCDVDETAWYYDVIGTAVKTKLISGLPGSSFNPDKTATRNDLAFYIALIDNANITEEKLNFKDVNDIPSWVRNSVAYVNNKGYINGYPDGTFKGNNPLSRVEAAFCLYKYLNY